jgi:hypothetical protein
MTRGLLLPFALLAVISSACGAQPSSEGDTGAGGGDWGGRTDIEAIFQNDCSQCHDAEWSSCWTVHEGASEVQGAIQSGAMPRGDAMAAADKAAVLAWLAAGATCAGTDPDGGVPLPGTGGDEPP